MLCHNSDNRESEERTLTINNVGQTIRNICLDVSTEDIGILSRAGVTPSSRNLG